MWEQWKRSWGGKQGVCSFKYTENDLCSHQFNPTDSQEYASIIKRLFILKTINKHFNGKCLMQKLGLLFLLFTAQHFCYIHRGFKEKPNSICAISILMSLEKVSCGRQLGNIGHEIVKVKVNAGKWVPHAQQGQYEYCILLGKMNRIQRSREGFRLLVRRKTKHWDKCVTLIKKINS